MAIVDVPRLPASMNSANDYAGDRHSTLSAIFAYSCLPLLDNLSSAK
ncbi:MAG: hypothetical protein KME08_00255 [Aphanothece sp. CMT-3BRIN-NPC111]|nr:hypothetical protein [Aphanothece sp. CMT-3BRIN-NPC111]